MKTKILSVIVFIVAHAYGKDSNGSEFIIKKDSCDGITHSLSQDTIHSSAVKLPSMQSQLPQVPSIQTQSTKSRSMSKNRLKEEIGDVTRRAFNSSTALGKIIGTVKISLADNFPVFYQIECGKLASDLTKNDGLVQIELSGIQGSFSDIISNLVENRGFFKKASRGDLRDLLVLIEEMSNNLTLQANSFNTLKISMTKIDTGKTDLTFSDKVKQQFRSSACELKKLQDKIKTSKCFKKSA